MKKLVDNYPISFEAENTVFNYKKYIKFIVLNYGSVFVEDISILWVYDPEKNKPKAINYRKVILKDVACVVKTKDDTLRFHFKNNEQAVITKLLL